MRRFALGLVLSLPSCANGDLRADNQAALARSAAEWQAQNNARLAQLEINERARQEDIGRVNDAARQHAHEIATALENEQKQAAEQRANAEIEKVRASCAADRDNRARARERHLLEQKKDEEIRTKNAARLALLEKTCKRRVQALRGRTGETCKDDDGVLRECEGIVGTEVFWDCPANGPPGARGLIQFGGGLAGDPARSARSSFIRDRDKLCAEADRDAAAR